MAKPKKAGKADSKDAKKARLAEKKAKQATKGEKKTKAKASKMDEDADSDVDIDAIMKEYQRQQELFLKVTEEVCESPPKPRAHASVLPSPCDGNSLLFFGGEYYNGARAEFFNDLHIYNIRKDEWRRVTSPNAPLPRSGHTWTRASNPNFVYLFGGEFSSPKQGTFHHYSDFWRLEPASREWTKIEVKGNTPPARSGHRMTYWKQYILLFGGFQDTSNQTKYLGDLWVFDTQNFMWHCPTLPSAQMKPDPRSSFTFLPHEQGAALYGGYSRVKVTVAANKNAKGSAKGQKNIVKPLIHQDCFFLRMSPPPENSPAKTPPTVRWERRKKPANTPNPTRAGATMAFHKGRGILFGGVHDVEIGEEHIDSEFFNQIFAWNIERNRFFPVALRKPRQPKKAGGGGGGGEQRVARRDRGRANEEELLKQLAALETGHSLDDLDSMEIDKKPEENEDEKPARQMPVSLEPPYPRFNAQLAVQDDTLFIYGGTFEKGDREMTFDDLYAIDLVKLDGCKEIFKRENEDWIESDESEDEDEDEYEDEDEEDEEGDIEMGSEPSTPLHTPSKRKTKQLDQESNASTESTGGTEPTDWDEAETAPTADDGLPHPRPFESRREFFARTGTEWQEVLIASLKVKNIKTENFSVKELKTKAFDLSEEKWWDCREEIALLEEEQEAAGITEVVSLEERGDGAGGLRRR